MASNPQNYTISDFIDWNSKKQLVLSPDFQRGSVWTQSAKVFLIDTILNDLPMPQVYFRTKIDASTQTMKREVVDGQQRLRAILEFAQDKFRLTAKSPNYKGLYYRTLSEDAQQQFLSYQLSAVQLINSSDAEVLEVFARLNSYSVKVTPAELRHAEFSEPVKWVIYDTTRKWSELWDKYKVVSVRDSVRLKNTSLIAEFFMSLDKGLGDGGEANITKYYSANRNKEEEAFDVLKGDVDFVIEKLLQNFGDDLIETTFFDAPNFLILFCAIAFLLGKMPSSRVSEGVDDFRETGINWENGLDELSKLSQAFDITNVDEEGNTEDEIYGTFVAASKSTTHRISSRQTRFGYVVRALANGPTS